MPVWGLLNFLSVSISLTVCNVSSMSACQKLDICVEHIRSIRGIGTVSLKSDPQISEAHWAMMYTVVLQPPFPVNSRCII